MSASPGSIQTLKEQVGKYLPIPEPDWKFLEPVLEERLIRKGDFFVKEGRLAREVGLLLSGSMRQYYTREGEEKTTYFYFENHFISGYISCLTGKPSELSIQALEDCRIIVFPYSALTYSFNQSKAWERFGRLIAEYHLIGLEERMVGLLTTSPEERYEELVRSNKRKILERIPQQYIANYLGITPVSLSRIRARAKSR